MTTWDPKYEGTPQTYGQHLSTTNNLPESRTFGQNAADIKAVKWPPTATNENASVAASTTPSVQVVATSEAASPVTPQEVEDFESEKESDALLGAYVAAFNGNPTVAAPVDTVLALQSSIRTIVDGASQSSIVSVVSVLESRYKQLEDVREVLRQAEKLTLAVTLRSKKSEAVEFNNIKVPNLKTALVYNFFEENEEDVEAQEDQSQDPLKKRRPVDVPRYVEVQWGSTLVTNIVDGTNDAVQKHGELRRTVFGKKKSLKDLQLFLQDGVAKTLVDVHAPNEAINSLNNRRTFTNTVSITMNVAEQPDNINEVPFTDVAED